MTPFSRTVDEDLISGAKKVEVYIISLTASSHVIIVRCNLITAFSIAPVNRASTSSAFIHGGCYLFRVRVCHIFDAKLM